MTKSPRIRRTSFAACLACLIALSLAAGCAPGDGQGLDQDGNLPTTSSLGTAAGGGGGPGASGNPDATLAWVQTNVFGGVCSQCHTGASAPLGLDWSSQTHTCANVGRQSAEIATMKEIESGNPAASYLIWKVEGAGPGGEPIAVGTGRMPLNNNPLPASTIQNMRDWIGDGAPGC